MQKHRRGFESLQFDLAKSLLFIYKNGLNRTLILRRLDKRKGYYRNRNRKKRERFPDQLFEQLLLSSRNFCFD